jgi:hypothetical protein
MAQRINRLKQADLKAVAAPQPNNARGQTATFRPPRSRQLKDCELHPLRAAYS